MVRIDEVTLTIPDGPNRAVRALLATRGVTMQEIVPALARRVDDLMFVDKGVGYVRSEPLLLDRDTRQLLEASGAKIRRFTAAGTYNAPVNIGATIMWDRMGQRIDAGGIDAAFKFLGVKQ